MDRWRRKPTELPEGIYDHLLTAALESLLRQLPDGLVSRAKPLVGTEQDLRTIDAFIRSALDRALSALAVDAGAPPAVVEDSAAALSEQEHQYATVITSRQRARDARLRFATELLAVFNRFAPALFDWPSEFQIQPRRLEAISRANAKAPEPPRGPLQYSQLLTNAPGEPLAAHLRSEFGSADRVDLLCAFLKVSGLVWLRPAIEMHTQHRQRALRVLTTTYCGATEAKAVHELALLPNVEVRISYDASSTRLHAKAWLFHRNSGFSTAYVGSSNLSHWAQTDGLEWNVRLTEVDQGQVIGQFKNAFEQYWDNPTQFEPYDPRNPGHIERLRAALARARDDQREAVSTLASNPELNLRFDIEAKDYQKPILAELADARAQGRNRNLLVAATGTGKTVMAALDFARLYQSKAVTSLLFVAHRREILFQSRSTFRAVLRQESFGELLVDGERPQFGTHVFASIDSLREGVGYPMDVSKYDMVIIDEAHHSAAASWDALLERIQPKELLGLTGTPERADGIDYDKHFPRPWVGNLRVWNAIPHALVPFRYHALDVQGVDLSAVRWIRGAYTPDELETKLVSAADVFVRRAIRAMDQLLGQPEQLRAIAFCASVSHARAVARELQRHSLKVAVLTGETAAATRKEAQAALDTGRLQILCVVDLYNEGVDVPNVNTLFFFRPTESATVWLQQLGRGLRRTPTKSELVVFDLTGRQHHSFRFDRRLRALLGVTPSQLKHLVEKQAFDYLPTGCVMQFEELAQRQILEQIKRAIPSNQSDIAKLLGEAAHANLSLEEFLSETEIALEDIYANKKHSWLGLRRRAGLVQTSMLDESEEVALGNVHKLLHVGDAVRLNGWERLIRLERPTAAPVDEQYRRVMRMLFGVLYKEEVAVAEDAWRLWSMHEELRQELASLVPVLRARNAVLRTEPDRSTLGWSNPLVLHARYLSVELSAAFNHLDRSGVLRKYYSGVEAVPGPGQSWDLLLVTLNKSKLTKDHLRYRDFPLGMHHFHWQSKARTTRESNEGRRHLNPEAWGCTPLLLVRDRDDERPGVTMAFQYLGAVGQPKAEGERPITIEWKLLHPMPDDVLARNRLAG